MYMYVCIYVFVYNMLYYVITLNSFFFPPLDLS